MKLIITKIQILLVTFVLQGVGSAQQKTLAEARLVVDSYSIPKDSIISIGVLVTLKDDWHIYWKNPGDSGIPTEIEFRLPHGIANSEIEFPIPEVIASDDIINYGYEHQVLFISNLKIPKLLKSKDLNISAKITSLICKDICKVFDTTMNINIDLSKNYLANLEVSQLFDLTRKSLPQKNHNLKINAVSKSDLVYLKLIDDKNLKEHNIQFLSYDTGVFKNSATQNIVRSENFIEIILASDPFRVKNPDFINGIIILEKIDISNNTKEAFEISLPIKFRGI